MNFYGADFAFNIFILIFKLCLSLFFSIHTMIIDFYLCWFTSLFSGIFSTPDRRQSKILTLLTNIDQKSLETEFSIAICPPTGDKWQSKTLFLAIFYLYSSIVKSVLDCRLSGMFSALAHTDISEFA